MAALQQTCIEGEKSECNLFDFAEWVQINDLTEIKDILEKHCMITISSMSMQSIAFQNVMSDKQILEHKSYMIPKLISAINNLPATSQSINSIFVVVSEEENNVIDCIKSNILKVEEIDSILCKLKMDHPKSIQRIKIEKNKQMELTQIKVVELFDDISRSLDIKKRNILNELNEIKNNIQNDNDDDDDDDNKENDILNKTSKELIEEKTYLKDKLLICDNMIKASDNNLESRKKRKTEIIKIGDDMRDIFNINIKKIENNVSKIENLVNINYSTTSHIDFNINYKNYKSILNNINNLGDIINNQYHPPSSNKKYKCNNSNIPYQERKRIESIEMIVKLQDEIKEYVEEIDTLQSVQFKNEKLIKQNEKLMNRIQTLSMLQKSKIEEIGKLKTNDIISELKKTLIFNDNNDFNFKWYEEQKEEWKPVFIVSTIPAVIYGIDKKYRYCNIDKLQNIAKINHIKDICKYIIHLKEFYKQSLLTNSIVLGKTKCEFNERWYNMERMKGRIMAFSDKYGINDNCHVLIEPDKNNKDNKENKNKNKYIDKDIKDIQLIYQKMNRKRHKTTTSSKLVIPKHAKHNKNNASFG